MATYIVGDIHGCFDELQQLLELADFSVEHDELWLTGDLVTRGPKSL
ncbi:MAG: metallophosphoesterase, partial [Psychromonas sp.]|nr:metallophosphoesterase [Psychromonas sp.]